MLNRIISPFLVMTHIKVCVCLIFIYNIFFWRENDVAHEFDYFCFLSCYDKGHINNYKSSTKIWLTDYIYIYI